MKKLTVTTYLITLLSVSFIISGCKSQPVLIPAKQYSVEDFFRNPEKTSFALSPDGSRFAYLAPYKSRLNIFIQEIGKEDTLRLTSDTLRNISWFNWANEKRILYLKDKGGDGYMRMFGIDIDGTNFKSLTDFDHVNTEIIDLLADQDDYIIVGLNKRNPEVSDAYRLNIKTGELILLAENTGSIGEWWTDHNGKLRLAEGTANGINTSIMYRGTEKEPFRTIKIYQFGESFYPLFFTSDNKKVIAISNVGRDRKVFVEFNPETGEEDSVIYENTIYDVIGLNYSNKRKILTAALYYSWKQEYHFFDNEYEIMFKKLESEFGEKNFSIVSTSKDETKRIVLVSCDKSMGSYYLYDKETGNTSKIADTKPWLDENEMADMVPVQYRSRDGLTIHGYLTFPKGYSMENAKNLPVVVHPHGGPWARDIWNFRPRVQFLANRGYIVFQMNFRGSIGYGKSFLLASRKEWGKSMQNDITDGVKWLIRTGIADPSRIAIYGASYGGYATLAGIAFTPELYAAAVDYCGISNLFTFLNSFSPLWKPYLEWYYQNIGDPVKDSVLLWEASPLFHIDSIRTPLMVIQGKNDHAVNINESNQIVNALRNRGLYVEYIVKENEGHIFKNEENVIEVYKNIERFLGEHLNNRK